jgi:YihY family inner membrane protein
MNVFERTFRRIDEFQQRHVVPSFVMGVIKKYGDNNGGALAVQLTYSMFMTVFPLLLLLITILSIVLAGDPSWRERVVNSAFGEFPIVGQQFSHNIHALKRSSLFGLAVGLLGLIYGTTRLAQSGLYAMAQVWNIPNAIRPNFVARLARSLTFLLLLAFGLALTTVLTALGGFGGHSWLVSVFSGLAATGINVVLYCTAFRVLTPKQVGWRALLPGAIFGGIAWTILQTFGTYVVGHDLRGSSALYGTFGLVLGLMAWIFLGAQITVYAAFINPVLTHHLWPRAIVQPPLTEADQRSMALLATQNQMRPEQEVRSRFHQSPMHEDEFRRRGYVADDSAGLEATVPKRDEGAKSESQANSDAATALSEGKLGAGTARSRHIE